MTNRWMLVGLTTLVFSSVLLPCAGMDLGLFIGDHCMSPYPTYWTPPEELLLRYAAVVGVQAEQRFGSVACGLRVGFLGDHAQSVWADERINQYRVSLIGLHSRVFGARRLDLLTEVLWTQAGIALACDYYKVTSWGEKLQVTGVLTQSMTAGLRARSGSRLTAGVDVDLNLAREGLSHYFYDDTGPSPYWFYRLGTMEPSVVLGASLSL